ncbi:MAG: hypothetical protein ACYS0G_04770 [Planctomycetota bacterium]
MCEWVKRFGGCCVVSILAVGISAPFGSAGEAGDAPARSSDKEISPEQAIALALASRISDMGPDGDEGYDASRPAVAYNSIDNEYLVVWQGDDNTAGLVDGEIEILGQRIDAFTGELIGAEDFRVSHMGPDGDPSFGGFCPAAAYNSTDNQYLVVWHGDDDSLGLVDEELEIYGQMLDAAGAAIGPAFRISAMGADGDPTFVARHPQVVYNGVSNEYLVVWEGIDDTGGLGPEEFEIFGQLLDPSGLEIGPDDVRLSDMGPDGNANFDAYDAAVTHNDVANEYLVVWEADDDSGELVPGEFEIFGQLVEASTGAEIGVNDFRVSVTGPDGAGQFDANLPSVAYNGADDEYLVVWKADGPPLPDGKWEIRGQRIDAATGNLLEASDVLISSTGDPNDPDVDAQAPTVTYNAFERTYLVVWHADDTTGDLEDNEFEIFGRLVTFPLTDGQFRISDMGTTDGEGQFDARRAVAVYNGTDNEFLVVWDRDDDTGELVNDELEVYGQRLAADTTEVGANDFRISTAGGDGKLAYDAGSAAVAYNSIDREYLVVWEGDDDTDPLVDGEMEIFGQRVDALTGAEIGANDFRISDMGPDGDTNYEGGEPAVAFNSIDNLYLVVWEGDDDTAPYVDEEFEIFGQLIDGATGAEIGSDFRISDVGTDGLDSRDAGPPAIAHDSVLNRFLVVWEADDSAVGTPNHKNEIFGQLLDGATGAEIGVNDFRISDMGPQDDPDFDAREAAVVFNPESNEYLVVWRGEDDAGGLVADEFEIYSQRIDAATGAEVGRNDRRISDMGPDGDPAYGALSPAVAHNPRSNEYLVVWRGDDDAIGLADGEYEIYGQRLNGVTGVKLGTNDFRISDMGPDGDPVFDAEEPSVAYNRIGDEYLVTWEANDDGEGLHALETEIYVQRLDASGSEIGPNDLRISQMGEDGASEAKARDPAVAYDRHARQYLLVWHGDDASGDMVDDENEIFAAPVLGGLPCQADFGGDVLVGINHLLELLAQWGTDPGGPPDLDGTVELHDLLLRLAVWWPCP